MPYIVGSEIIQCESGLTYIKVCSSRNNAADLFGHKFCREKLLLPPEIIKTYRVPKISASQGFIDAQTTFNRPQNRPQNSILDSVFPRIFPQ